MKQLPIKCLIFIAAFALPAACFAMTAQELKQALDASEKITIIDIRARAQFSEAHIPGAINIPAAIIEKKQLPPLGRVVVYGDGILAHKTRQALAAINAKPGINAELLEGGVKAWDSLSLPSTETAGLKDDNLQYISYQDLKELLATDNNVVIVDLRLKNREANASNNEGLTDIAEQFPSVEILGSNSQKNLRADVAAVITHNNSGNNSLYVLVDNGNNRAEHVARHLWAAGIKRTVVLAGGEEILSRRGFAGTKTVIRDGRGVK